MKTFICLLLTLLFYSCSFLQMPEEHNKTPCFYPIYKPPKMIPGSAYCLNHCQYVYEGIVNFETDRLEINCLELPLINEKMSWTVDSTTVRHVTEGYIPIIRIQTPGFTHWCKRDFSIIEISCFDIDIQKMETIHYNGNGEIRIIMGPGFWNCYSGSNFIFRLTSTEPFL